MKLPKEICTVTPVSKQLAVIAFVTLPFIAFFLGINYQKEIDNTTLPPLLTTSAPTQTPDEWKEFKSSNEDFSFSYPASWKVGDGPNILSVTNNDGTAKLHIVYRSEKSTQRTMRTGVAAGDVLQRGSVKFLGLTVPKYVLVFQGKDKNILYNNGSEIKTNGYIFVLSVDPISSDYNLDQKTEVEADKIIESFQITPRAIHLKNEAPE